MLKMFYPGGAKKKHQRAWLAKILLVGPIETALGAAFGAPDSASPPRVPTLAWLAAQSLGRAVGATQKKNNRHLSFHLSLYLSNLI